MLKLIQLNCFQFNYFDEILKYLTQQNPDIINLQEATTGEMSSFGNGIYLQKLASSLGMQVIYAPFTAKESQDGRLDWFGNAILTKLEVLDHGVYWLHDGQNKVGIITHEDNQKLQQAIKVNRNFAYPVVYNQPKNLVWALFSYKGKMFRSITSHFTATQKCTETLQMIQETQSVVGFINNIKDMPTFFTGDLNIHQQAGCIASLKANLELVNKGTINTLTPLLHPIFEPKYQELDPGLRNGLSVDYVFEKGIKILKWKIDDVQISDHLPVVVEFEL